MCVIRRFFFFALVDFIVSVEAAAVAGAAGGGAAGWAVMVEAMVLLYQSVENKDDSKSLWSFVFGLFRVLL